MKKKLTMFFVFTFFISTAIVAAIPTEEGLLKNLNNNNIPGSVVNIKAAITKISDAPKNENSRTDYYRFIINFDGGISILQVNYSGSQMLATQIQDVKLLTDVVSLIKKEKAPEKGLFYGTLLMLALNQPTGMEAFLEKTGNPIIKNKSLLNEEKMKLLRTYRNYLATTKGKGEATSPLNPSDKDQKQKVLEVFKSNSYKRSKNIELVKIGNDFIWKVDWKSVQGYFTNEEKQFKKFDFITKDFNVSIEAAEYLPFNNNNEFPKNIYVKDSLQENFKMITTAFEVKKTLDKSLADKTEEYKKSLVKNVSVNDIFSFLY
jgi:hypothetical protein